MLCGGPVPRRNLAYLRWRHLPPSATWQSLSTKVGPRLPADWAASTPRGMPRSETLALVVYRRPARPLQPPGLPRQMLQQSSKMRRAAWPHAWAQPSRRGLPAVRATCQRLLDSQGHPAGMLIIDPSEWLAIIDRDEQQVIRAIAPAVLPRPLSDSTWHELRRP